MVTAIHLHNRQVNAHSLLNVRWRYVHLMQAVLLMPAVPLAAPLTHVALMHVRLQAAWLMHVRSMDVSLMDA